MTRKLTYANVFAMLEKMEANAEYEMRQLEAGDDEKKAFLHGVLHTLNRVSNEFSRSQDGWSSMLGSVRATEAAE